MASGSLSSKVETYHEFIEEKLKKDLYVAETAIQRVRNEKQHWQDAKLNFKMLRLFRDKCPTEDLILDIPFCEWDNKGITVSGTVTNHEQVYINIGCNVHLPMYLDEADKYADIRIRAIDRQIKHYMDLAVQIKSHIKVTLLAINEIEGSNK